MIPGNLYKFIKKDKTEEDFEYLWFVDPQDLSKDSSWERKYGQDWIEDDEIFFCFEEIDELCKILTINGIRYGYFSEEDIHLL